MVKWKKMNKKMAGLLLGVMMLFTASTTAFAYVDESAEASKVETTQTEQSTDKEEKKDEATNTNEVLPEDGTDKGTAFTTPGNGEVKDDITDDSTKEFLTVTTKNNNTFYIVIDRSATSQKGECSGVLAEDGARAVLTPAKENVRQNGRRMKEPEEPMFTITATDRHGILYHGRIRRLVPRECLRLQGYYDWQIDKIIDSTSDAQLYKQAGNGVTVNVIEAIGRLLQKADSELNTQKVSEKGIH